MTCAVSSFCSANINNRHNISFMGSKPAMTLKKVSETLCSDFFEKQISPFDNPVIYQYLGKDSRKLDDILNKIYRRKLPQIDKQLEESNIAAQHRVLLVDPEVTAHLDELAEFVTEKKIDTTKISPFDLRQRFSEYLGTETVYRGLKAPDCEELISTLKQEGIYPKQVSDKANFLESIKYYLTAAGEPVLNVFSRLEDVIRGRKNTEFMSVSSLYDVSASVAKGGSNNAKTPVVVAKLEVPKLSVIKQKGNFAPRRTTVDQDVLIIGDKKYDYETQGEKIEAFIPYHIPTKKAEFTIDTKTPDYRWG